MGTTAKRKQLRVPDSAAILEKFSTHLDIPAGSMPNFVHIELDGNLSAIVDGCKGVLEYNENTIRLNTGRLIVRVCGNALTITSMQNGQAVITGCIAGLDFST